MKSQYETFLALSSRVAICMENLEGVKEKYLRFRSKTLGDTHDPFAVHAPRSTTATPRIIPSTPFPYPIGTPVPSTFTGFTNNLPSSSIMPQTGGLYGGPTGYFTPAPPSFGGAIPMGTSARSSMMGPVPNLLQTPAPPPSQTLFPSFPTLTSTPSFTPGPPPPTGAPSLFGLTTTSSGPTPNLPSSTPLQFPFR